MHILLTIGAMVIFLHFYMSMTETLMDVLNDVLKSVDLPQGGYTSEASVPHTSTRVLTHRRLP
jgi:hypothetical protein